MNDNPYQSPIYADARPSRGFGVWLLISACLLIVLFWGLMAMAGFNRFHRPWDSWFCGSFSNSLAATWNA
jgi:hypothetical protein